MKLSIVIPTKNEEKWLPRLLASIKSQLLDDYEIIVADANSTDATRELARTAGARVIEGGMPGPGRNRGAAAAQGDVIVFFDADVVLPNQRMLDDCLREMAERNLDVATCRVAPLDGSGRDHVMHEVYNWYAIATEKILPHAPGFCIFAKRQAHEAIKGFDEEVVFAEDHDYVRRAAKLGYNFGILRSHRVPVSVRRLDKDGRLNTAAKYVYSEAAILARGPFKKKTPFDYEMGEYEK